MLLLCNTILNLFFHLHKTFILEATKQGIPETTIYCTMKYNTQEVYSKRRFDWVTVIDGGTNERVACQLTALWELRRSTKSGMTKKSVLYYSCILTTHFRPPRHQVNFEVFTKLRYQASGLNTSI